MTLPTLYVEGLRQRALLGQGPLNVYKLGLIEAILKETLRGGEDQAPETLRAAIQTALDVARWELRPPPQSHTSTDGAGR